MSKKYESLAHDIVANIGGQENVSNVYHCMTRLRFTLANNAKANKDALEKIEGVTKVIINAGVYQVVIGPHVADVFEEVIKLVDIDSNNVTQSNEKKGIFNTIFDFISGTFQPVIPALSGAGMVKAVLAILVVFKIISNESQTYYLLNMFSDGVFYFLPMILAYTVAQKLKANPILAVSVAAMMLHPNWFALVTAGEPVSFFGVVPFT
ncbi:MAG: PTS transporter subunit EIIB, partial [Alphaproteobacteria bacterium]|nr:PTS transporter subunit EIIB [Alphaproteobacteria bacterium]